MHIIDTLTIVSELGITPKQGRLRDSKVYLESGVYKLPRHSKVRRKTRFELTRNEMEFATLIEAAVFISGNNNSDETFFMNELFIEKR